MKRVILFLGLQIAMFNLFAQETFEKTYGTMLDDVGLDLEIFPDGSYLVCGYTTEFFSGYDDMNILKLDQNGDTIWTKSLGLDEELERAYSIKACYDGGFVVCGFATEGDMFPILYKFDDNSDLEWTRDYKNQIPDGVAYDVIQNPDSSFALCGTYTYSVPGSDLWGQKVFLLKTDQNGNYEWLELYGDMGVHYGVRLTHNELGGYSICGKYDTQGEYDAAWLFKTMPNGYKVGEFTSGGEQTIESAWDMQRTADDGYILTGSKFNGIILLNGDIQLQKVDSDLNEEWTQILATSEDDRGSCVDIVGDEGYIVCGTTKSTASGYKDIWLIRTNINGDTLWTERYGGYYGESVGSVKSTPDGGFIICGSTWSMGNGMDDVYIIKTNSQGTLVWAQEYSFQKNNITVFPNPGNGLFNIQSIDPITKIDLFDSKGLLLQTINKSSDCQTNTELDIRSFPKGEYFIKLNDYKVYKIIKN